MVIRTDHLKIVAKRRFVAYLANVLAMLLLKQSSFLTQEPMPPVLNDGLHDPREHTPFWDE
jgi:hypothetical protein